MLVWPARDLLVWLFIEESVPMLEPEPIELPVSVEVVPEDVLLPCANAAVAMPKAHINARGRIVRMRVI
jgi:hypothetical protein